MLPTVIFSSCCLPPNQMTTVFAGLRQRRLELVDTSATQRENRSTAATGNSNSEFIARLCGHLRKPGSRQRTGVVCGHETL